MQNSIGFHAFVCIVMHAHGSCSLASIKYIYAGMGMRGGRLVGVESGLRFRRVIEHCPQVVGYSAYRAILVWTLWGSKSWTEPFDSHIQHYP